MSLDNEKDIVRSEEERACGCGCGHDHGHGEDNCCGGHEHGEDGCCGGHEYGDCDCGCGCGHDHGNQYLTLILEDDSEMKCQILGTFENEGHEYIALLHPSEESVFLFRYHSNEDHTIDIEEIADDQEYDAASKLFMSLFNS